MKAHKSPDGRPLLFRPRENARRLQRFAVRLTMAAVPESMFLDGLRQLVRLDDAWILPAETGRTVHPADLVFCGPVHPVKAAESFRFMILTFPFGAYFAAPVDVLVSEQYVRAFPGGPGDTKPAGNYAAALLGRPASSRGGIPCSDVAGCVRDGVMWKKAV
jgi:branched-chain amino acid aminotransferase